jgi:hypothetical protein
MDGTGGGGKIKKNHHRPTSKEDEPGCYFDAKRHKPRRRLTNPEARVVWQVWQVSACGMYINSITLFYYYFIEDSVIMY